MKQHYNEGDSSIGWFKLALLISRGEKEKALGLYRLLSYSLEDKAYVLQVEGDLLAAFADKESLTKYQQAAFLYVQEKKMSAALGVYEHLIARDCSNILFLEKLLELYAWMEWEEKVKALLEHIVVLYNTQKLSLYQVRTLEKNVTQFFETSSKRSLLSLMHTVLAPLGDETAE